MRLGRDDGTEADLNARAPEDEPARELVERARSGDAAAFDLLAAEWRRGIHRWATAMSGDPDEADDVTQTVLLKLERSLGTFAGTGSFSSWLYRITRNAWLDRRRARSTVSLEAAPGGSLGGPAEDPARRIDAERLAGLVRRYFAELPGRQREAFDLVDLQGLEPAEAARLLGLEKGTVRVHLFRARARIRRRMLEDHPEWTEEYR